MNDLLEVKRVSKSDLKHFLTQDHTSFSVLSVSTKHIESTDRISVTLSKNSARSFYLGQESKNSSSTLSNSKPSIPDNCLQDAQNCTYFSFFNSKEKKLYLRFKDKVEANFEGTEGNQPVLFLTLTFNTTHDNYQAFTFKERDLTWGELERKRVFTVYLNVRYEMDILENFGGRDINDFKSVTYKYYKSKK